jgi:Tol biopolymer transport system component
MRDIYIASLDMATGKVTVPPAPVNPRLLGGNKTSAAWSPDGQYLAYRMADGVTRIRSMKTDEERELPSNLLRIDTRFGRIRWSPDGRSLLASARDDKQRLGLYQIDVQTGAVASIVQDEGFPHGVWSADGKAVFYALERPAQSTGLRTTPAIRVRDLETGREREIYRPALPLPTRISHLALSPDGQWLAFVSVRESEIASNPPTEEKLLVMPAAGGDPRELLKVHKGAGEEVNDLTALEWTRDGDQLVYHWNRELWKISAKGGEPQKLGLASTTARQTSLSLHPDGQRIAFTAGEPKFDVWVMENFWPALPASR